MTVEAFRYPLVELYASGDWHDVTEDVRYSGGIAIDRGRGGEDNAAPPQTCRITFDDRNGDYNPRNPTGAHFGSIGRNTPLRVALVLGSTTFDTTATNGWGSTDAIDGQTAYAWTSSGGVVADYAVSGGAATHALAAAGNIRLNYLADVDLRDVEVRTTVTVPTADITGTGAVGVANLVLHGQTSPALGYYMLRLLIQPDESVTVDFHYATSLATTSITGSVLTLDDLTHDGSPLRVAFGIEGRTLRAKIWKAADPEPYAWSRTYTDEDTAGARATVAGQAGFVGVRSSLVAGNTNGPITLSYNDFEVRHPRFSGEVSTWPAARDVSGNDITVTVTASGPKRRGAAGASPLDSPLRRQLGVTGPGVFGVEPLAYWPLEDRFRQVAGEVLAVAGSGRLEFVPPTTGTTAGKISWASDSGLPGSDALPTLTGGGSLVGYLNPMSWAIAWYLVWAEKINVTDGCFSLFATAEDHIQLVTILDPATPTVFNVYLTAPGVSALIMTHTFASKEDVEQWHMFEIDAEQIASDVAFYLLVDGVLVDSHTQSLLALAGLHRLQLSSPASATGNTGIGHVAVYEAVPSTSAYVEAFGGNTSETAGQRMQRLCREEAAEFDWVGTVEVGTYPPVNGHTAPVGTQDIGTLLTLLESAAAVDQGMLFEQRAIIGYHYRTRRSLYSQAAAVTLSYADGEIAPEWRPVDDDRYTRNDVTAQRTDGGSYRHEVTTGRLSTAAVEDGGAGRYRESVTFNVQTDGQLPGLAEWRAHLGTVDETRYPSVNVQLHGHALRGQAAKLQALLDLDVGDRLVIEDVAAVGVADAIDQLVVGYSEVVSPHVHELSLVCAPASPYRALTLDDAELGRADSDASTLAEDLDTTETAVDVATAAGAALWTTDPTQFPLDVVIGGEVMTVTAISGTSSPQTFTVTRSTNGVVKTHSTGDAVHLARPVYAGL